MMQRAKGAKLSVFSGKEGWHFLSHRKHHEEEGRQRFPQSVLHYFAMQYEQQLKICGCVASHVL